MSACWRVCGRTSVLVERDTMMVCVRVGESDQRERPPPGPTNTSFFIPHPRSDNPRRQPLAAIHFYNSLKLYLLLCPRYSMRTAFISYFLFSSLPPASCSSYFTTIFFFLISHLSSSKTYIWKCHHKEESRVKNSEESI